MALAQEDPIVAIVQENAGALLRLARQHSLCDDDAADAYQRTLEIYLGRMERLDPGTVGAWLRTVCKHEAMRIRAARQRVLPPDPVAWDEWQSFEARDAEERAESLERVAHAAEALAACRPEEAQAMLLRASGASYADISAQCGWSYSQVNRAIAGGRARFLSRFARIESGEACAGHLDTLSAIVDGEATPDDFLAVRPHLRHCASCRATLKALYDSEPALGALLPAGGIALAAAHGPGALTRALEGLSAQVGERVVRAHAWLEAATSGKAAAVVASTAAVAAGGAVVETTTSHPPRPRPHVLASHRAARTAHAAPTATATQPPAPAATAPPPAPASPPAATPQVRATATPTPVLEETATPAATGREFAVAAATARPAPPAPAASEPAAIEGGSATRAEATDGERASSSGEGGEFGFAG